jgi:UDP-N-acetylmuramoyl-tripeptide--D-alanyl-D-alanine ligase
MNINSKTIHQELMRTDLKNIHSLLKGSEIIGNADAFIDRVQMDSRDVQSGDLFIALKGDRFDAHDFLADIADCRKTKVKCSMCGRYPACIG